jgi:uncharacterized protein involved in outer membrane biogenesis
MTRTKSLWLLAPLALVIALALLLPLLLDKDKILELALSTIHEQTGATVAVEGAADLQLLPRIGVALDKVSLALPGERVAQLRSDSLRIGLQWLPLLTGRFEVASLHLNGSVLELPAADGGPPALVEVPRFEAGNLNLDARPIALSASVRLPGDEPIELELNGSVRYNQDQQTLLLEPLEVTARGATASDVALVARGEADLDAQTADLQLTLKMAQTEGEGTLLYAAADSPNIDAKLHFNLLDPALLMLAGPAAADGAAQADAGDDKPLPLEALRSIDTHAELQVDKALLQGHEIENLQLSLRADNGLIRIKSLSGSVHGGQLAAEAALNANGDNATLTSSGSLTGLDIATALAAAKVDANATGRANLDWSLASRGATQNALIAGLSGPIKLTTQQVILEDIGIEGMLCQAVALTNQESLSTSFPASTRLETLAADIRLMDGRATLHPLRAELAQISLAGNGSYDLLSRDFDLTFKARLSPELENLDRACRVSKRLTAIDWPVNCRGNANGEAGKWCSVDAQAIIEDLTKNEAERKLKKKAGKLLDKLFN